MRFGNVLGVKGRLRQIEEQVIGKEFPLVSVGSSFKKFEKGKTKRGR